MFISNKNRNINKMQLRKRIEKQLMKKGSVYWLKTLNKNGIPCSKINKISDVINNPQIINRGMIFNYSDKDIKNLKLSDTPFKFNFYKSHKKKEVAPELNENKKEILKMLLD
jgi:CoA:oxalate CoA-transferase